MKANAPSRFSLCLLASLGLGLMPGAARAADGKPAAAPSGSPSVAQLNEEGAALYAARDYRRAIEKFIQAYAIDADPNLLFNIARCYEELGEVEAAIEKYETFLKTPGADTRGRQRASESLAALREVQSSAASVAPAAFPKAALAPDAATPAAPESAESAPNAVLPWLVLSGAGVFAVVGTTFYLLGASDHAQVTDARGYGDANAVADMTRRQADDWVSSGNSKKLIGGISFGLAGALAATYVVLLVNGDDESPAQTDAGPSLGWSLVPARGGASVSARGSF
jgi:tetratricopeptide (TPR) repeat protein